MNYIYKDELYHHGIKGQKWGVRRFQNPDGSYTSEGRKRRSDLTSDEKNERRKKIAKKVAIGAAVVGGTILAAYGGYHASRYLSARKEVTNAGKSWLEIQKTRHKMLADRIYSDSNDTDKKESFVNDRLRKSSKDFRKNRSRYDKAMYKELLARDKAKFRRATNKYARMLPPRKDADPLTPLKEGKWWLKRIDI